MPNNTAAVNSRAPGALLALLAAVATSIALDSGCQRRATSSEAPAVATSPALSTTDGALAFANLTAELGQAERQHAARPADPARARQLVDRLLARAQFAARLTDLDRADAVSVDAVMAAAFDAGAHVLRAHVLATLHRFPYALAQLTLAEKLGGDRGAID